MGDLAGAVSLGWSEGQVWGWACSWFCRRHLNCTVGPEQAQFDCTDHTLHQRWVTGVSPALWNLPKGMQSAPSCFQRLRPHCCQVRDIHFCFSLPCHGVFCTGSCLRWFENPLHIWLAKTVTSAESLYMYDKTESCLFYEALFLWENIVAIKPSSLLRHSSSSTSVNVIFQQEINKDSLAYSYFLAVLTLQTLKLSGDLILFCVQVPAKLLNIFSPSRFEASLNTLSSPIGAHF